jgi:hypothetical protein
MRLDLTSMRTPQFSFERLFETEGHVVISHLAAATPCTTGQFRNVSNSMERSLLAPLL